MVGKGRISSAVLAIAAFAALGCGGAGKAAPAPAEAVAPDAGPLEAPPALDPACAGLEEKAHAVWSPEIRDGLDFSVRIYEGEILAADAELAVDRLDEFTAAWMEASTRACGSHSAAGTLGGDEYRGLAACLDRALQAQRAVIDSMKTGGKAAIAQAQTLPAAIKGCTGEAIDASATTDMHGNPFQERP